MIDLKIEVWFVTGSQHLYGEETLKQVAEHSQEIAEFIKCCISKFLLTIVYKPTVKTPEEIYAALQRSKYCTKTVLVSSHGCIHFLLQKCGSVV